MTADPFTLSGIDVLSDLSPEQAAAVAGQCTWRRFAAGEQVFDSASDCLEVYFVVSGAVRILSQTSEREVALADMEAGRYFGELAAIDGLPRSARVVATADSLLASLDGPAFRALLLSCPALCLRVMGRMTRVIRELDRRVIDLSTTSETERVCAQLLRLAAPLPGRPQGWVVAPMPNHAEIAAWVGSSRQTVAQVLGELARDGVVRRRTGGLEIVDPARLRLLARAA